MKKQALLYLSIVINLVCSAQIIKKYPISNSGCSVYMYCKPEKFDIDYSEDSSKVYTAECENAGVNYGVICIKLLDGTQDLDATEEVVISYLDYLKGNFNIVSAAGYGKGHHLNNNEKTRGIIDYWEDKDKNHWKIKAWTDGKFIGVLYAYTAKELPEQKVNVFLDGFRLPEK